MTGIIAVTGHTYPHREAIRRLGGRWDAQRKVWWIADAGMSRQPHYDHRPRVETVKAAIARGELAGCRVEWVR
ncbi:MAG TPA: hypothetical protein VNL18_15595 [Gemmatimonadales bacterium]|nr:hypothetical protein [Gemmatimonadales bacterium]